MAEERFAALSYFVQFPENVRYVQVWLIHPAEKEKTAFDFVLKRVDEVDEHRLRAVGFQDAE